MICSKCGNPVTEGNLYCEYCGWPTDNQLNLPVLYQPQQNQTNTVQHRPEAPMIYDDPTPVEVYNTAPVHNNINNSSSALGNTNYNPYTNGYYGAPTQNESFNYTPQPEAAVNNAFAANTASSKKDIKTHALPRKKLLLIAGIASGAVVFVCILLLVAYSLFMTPKRRVMKAFASTYNTDYIADSFLLEDRLGVYDISKSIVNDGGVIDFTLKGEADDVEGEISFNLQKSNKDRKMSIATKAVAEDEVAVDSIFLADNDNTYALLSGVDGYFAIRNEHIVSQIADSELFEDMEIHNDQDFSINWFNGYSIIVPDEKKELLSKESQDELSQILNDAIVVEKSGTQQITIGGKDRKATKYNLTITQEGIEDYYKALKDIYKEDYADISDEIDDEIDDEMDYLLESIKRMDDIEAEVLIYKGKIAEFSFDTIIEDYDKTKLSCRCTNSGKNNILSDVDFEFTVDDDGYKESLTYTKTTKKITDGTREEYEIYLNDDDGIDIKVIQKSKKLSIDISEKQYGYTNEVLSFKGTIEELKKSNSFDLVIDKFEFEDDELLIDDCHLIMEAGSSSAKPEEIDSSKEVLYILEATEEERDDFITRNLNSDQTSGGSLGRYIEKSQKASDVASASTISIAAQSALASEYSYMEIFDSAIDYAEEYTLDDDTDSFISIVAEAEPGEPFTAAPGLSDDEIENFLNDVNNDIGNAAPDIKYTQDSGYGTPEKWVIGINEDTGKPYIYIASSYDYFAYELSPDTDSDYR